MSSISPCIAQAEEGQASYYAHKFKGRRTSSGEKYHPDSLTAAHRTYPFGTLLLVTNKQNGKQVVVKVNDRGPFTKGRVVDLSMKAALQIDMVRSGIVPVRVELAADTMVEAEKDGGVPGEPEIVKPIGVEMDGWRDCCPMRLPDWQAEKEQIKNTNRKRKPRS